MTTLTDVPRPTGANGVRSALVVTVCGSTMAGLVHGAAARGHEGDSLLVWMFALCALAQVAWAVVALFRPTRPVLVAGVVINGGAFLVWAITRTVGIPFIDSLAAVEGVGTQDLVAALFAAASVAAALRMLVVPVVRTTITPVWAGALAVVALLATMPALRADHTHGDHTHLEAAGGGHSHDDGTAEHAHDEGDPEHAHDESDPEHAHDETDTTDGHGHDDETDTTDGHAHDGATEGELASHGHSTTGDTTGHHDPSTGGGTHPHPPTTEGPHDHPDEPTTPDHPHPPADPDDPEPTGPIISLDDPRVTPAQRAIAQSLIDGVQNSLAGRTVASIKAAGYQWIGDGGSGGYQHYVNWSYYSDGIEMNPAKIESIVVQNGKIVSGMYILNPGKTMADTPALAGELTTWHDHQNLCFSGTTLVGISVNGSCDPAKGGPGGTLTPTPPMLHVWLVPNPCGPFAGIESHGGSDCGTHDH